MQNTTKSFPIADVLSTVTGRLMGKIGGVYEVLNFMTDENLYTHQLPRVCREAVPVFLAKYPSLQQAIDEAGQVTPENYLTWLATWTARYGETLDVPKMSEDDHERIDMLSELAEHVHPDKIIVI